MPIGWFLYYTFCEEGRSAGGRQLSEPAQKHTSLPGKNSSTSSTTSTALLPSRFNEGVNSNPLLREHAKYKTTKPDSQNCPGKEKSLLRVFSPKDDLTNLGFNAAIIPSLFTMRRLNANASTWACERRFIQSEPFLSRCETLSGQASSARVRIQSSLLAS